MKIRNGFVSNSSTSSFVVHNIYWAHKGKILNAKDIKKLLEYGFKETKLTHPSHLDNTRYDDQSIWTNLKNDKGRVIVSSFGYWVSCNQDEVIRFLVKNNIGFIATVHYGHYHYLFHKGDKYVMVFNNYGAQVETYYYNNKWEDIIKIWKTCQSEPYYKISVKEFLKED